MGHLRKAFLLSAVLWGAVLPALSEVLSLGRALAPLPVAAARLVLCLPLADAVARKRAIPAFAGQVSEAWHSLSRPDRIPVILHGVVCEVLLGTAVISPLNNVDLFLPLESHLVLHVRASKG